MFQSIRAFSAVIELSELVETDRPGAVFVTSSHNVVDVLFVDGVIKVLSKDLLQVLRLDNHALVAVEDAEGGESLLLLAWLIAGALWPSQIDDFLEELIVKAWTSVVLTVSADELLLLLTLWDSVETEIVDDAFEVTSVDELITASEELKRVA